jgi:lipopolysaccharide export system permease protein
MATMTQYVLRELVRVFLCALVALTGVMLVAGVVNEAVKQGLPPAHALGLIPFVLPEYLSYTIPVAFLLGTTSVYSRMSGYNEVVAIKALGISPVTILWPAFALACLLSFGTVLLNDEGVSWGRLGAQRTVLEGVEEIAYGMLRTEGCYNSAKFSINVKRIDGRRLIRPIITIAARGDMPAIFVKAEEGSLQSDPWENVLRVVLRDGEYEIGGNISGRFRGEAQYEIPLSDASRADERSRSPSCLPLWRIPGEIAEEQEAIGRHQEDMAATAAFQMLTGDFDALTGPAWGGHMVGAEEMRSRLCRLESEPYRRWSLGFSCLFFVWVGAPMAIWLRNKEFLTSFFLCFAPILVVYFPLFFYGIDGAKNGSIPPISVWAGNVVLLAAGAWLLRKVLRH